MVYYEYGRSFIGPDYLPESICWTETLFAIDDDLESQSPTDHEDVVQQSMTVSISLLQMKETVEANGTAGHVATFGCSYPSADG